MSRQSPLVSVIVPVYNGEKYLARCLESILGQTMQDFELIVVDDGSTDRSPELLRRYAAEHPRLTVLTQANAGQGNARNEALGVARGEYVLFVDSDDFIEAVALQVLVERAEDDGSDLVHFDWKFVRDKPDHLGKFDYYNTEPFWHLRVLEGADCELLFQMHSYFSVTNLYRRSFLDMNGARFEEGQIYEDNPFLARVFLTARKVSLVHSPLYAIQANPHSSTKTGTSTDRHMVDHLSAVRKSFAQGKFRSASGKSDLAEYHLEKFAIYYERRVPSHLRSAYARDFVAILGAEAVQLPKASTRKAAWLTQLCVRAGVVERQKPKVLEALIRIKSTFTPPAKRALAGARKVKRRVRHPLITLSNLGRREPSLEQGTILFLGFDGRYTGNSLALFEQLLEDERFSGRTLLFATDDKAVDAKHRVKPGSLRFMRAAKTAEFVIAETWIPSSVPKHPDSTWIQLWHGTPIKRMLFDSHEKEITTARPLHKVNKYKDIQRWDHFVVDSELAAERFSTAFLLAPETMLLSEYPRVARLRRRAGDGEVREQLRAHANAVDSFTVLYAPTWRDRNYARVGAEIDSSHHLDLAKMSEAMGSSNCLFLFKDHDFLGGVRPTTNARVRDVTGADIDDLLLMTDVLITDYSSVAFDAISVGLPVVSWQADVDSFIASRGTYLRERSSEALFSRIVEEVTRLSKSTRGGDHSGLPSGGTDLLLDRLRA